MWQKQQQVGSHMACALFVNLLVEWKVWKRHSRVCWTKITILYNFRNVYQTKDTSNLGQKVWKAFKFESSRRVIIVHLHIAVVKVLRKTLIAMWQTLSRSKLFSTRTLIIVPLSFLWMPWHQFELDVWSWLLASFRVRDLASDSYSEVKIPGDFGWAQNIQLLHGFLASTELLAFAGVDSLVLVGRKIDRGKTRSSFVVVWDNCSLPFRAPLFICSLEVGFLPFLGSSTLAMQDWCPFFWGLLQML